jgi:glyoxylase-like metal-dependent hydrolase (beta-lactamase superfamily II)
MSSNVTILEPARFKLDGGAMFGIIPKPLWNRFNPADEQNRIDLALRLVLIQQEKRNILIDTGIGDYHPEKFNTMFDVRGEQGPLEQSLKKAGLECSDITDIVISHLHFDHVGGLGKQIGENHVPLFPHATLHLHKDHFAYAQRPTQRDAGSFHHHTFLPLIDHYNEQNLIHWLEGTKGEIFSDGSLKFLISKGHTPFMIHPYNDQFIYLADIVPTSSHIKTPWVMGYDIAPGISVENKKEILQFALENKLTVIYEHDPFFWGSTLDKDEKGNIIAGEKHEALKELSYKVELSKK